jgi:hypothetical protein
MFNKSYDLPLSEDYVRDWSMPQAVRELFQNAIDSDSPFEYLVTENDLNNTLYDLEITSRNSILHPSTLVLGGGSKADQSDKIGTFGEGYKLALLVLTREGYKVDVFNGHKIWSPHFSYSSKYETDILSINETKNPEENQGLKFVIKGLRDDDIKELFRGNLHIEDSEEFRKTRYGRVLNDRPGELFVNGLFVCKTELKYGYDINPEHLQLERDRQTVDAFNLTWTTSQMWLETGENEHIVKEVADGVNDFSSIGYNAPPILREVCYRHFKSHYKGSIAVTSHEELEKLVADGMREVVVVNSNYKSMLGGSDSYKSSPEVKQKTPQEVLAEFYSDNSKYMKRAAQAAFKPLLNTSEQWRLK